MNEEIEVLYGDDRQAKLFQIQRCLSAATRQTQRKEPFRVSLLLLKAVQRVLIDDAKDDAELAYNALKCFYVLFGAADKDEITEFLSDNGETVLGIVFRIFSREFRRAELSTQLATLLLLVLRALDAAIGDGRARFRQRAQRLGLSNALQRLLECEDVALVETVLSFVAERVDESVVSELCARGLLAQMASLVATNERAVFASLSYIAVWESVRIGLSNERALLVALLRRVSDSISALTTLYRISSDAATITALTEIGLCDTAFELLSAESEFVWFTLTNIARNSAFASAVFASPRFVAAAETLLKECLPCALRFLEALCSGVEGETAKAALGGQSLRLIELLEERGGDATFPVESVIEILSAVYALSDRRGVTAIMRLAKQRPTLLPVAFRFINSTLCLPHFDRELINAQIIEHIRGRYLGAALGAALDAAARFELLALLLNALRLHGNGLSFDEFQSFLAAAPRAELAALALNGFDAFLARAPTPALAELVRTRKHTFYASQ